MDQERVVVAEILRERGNRGEVLARPSSDVPGRLESLTKAQVRMASGHDEEVVIESSWSCRGDWIFKFAGVDSIDSAKRYRGADVWLPKQERGQLSEGEYFQSDLVGCNVFDRKTGRIVGTVEGFQHYGGPALMEVESEGREVLIPFVPAICTSVDLNARSIWADLPEGLLDL